MQCCLTAAVPGEEDLRFKHERGIGKATPATLVARLEHVPDPPGLTITLARQSRHLTISTILAFFVSWGLGMLAPPPGTVALVGRAPTLGSRKLLQRRHALRRATRRGRGILKKDAPVVQLHVTSPSRD